MSTAIEHAGAELGKLVWPRIQLNDYIPHAPTLRQAAGLWLRDRREVLYGGAAGGGKSDWLLMCGLQFVTERGYTALLLRRTYAQLSKADGLMERAHEWLGPTDASFDGKLARWSFPSGALLEFGHIQFEKDKYNYQSSAYQFIGFDELTQFTETQYRYLFSRLRRLKGSNVPLRMRSGSNPGGEGHGWVARRFVPRFYGGSAELRPDRVFLPARLEDNPYLDREQYVASLANLDPITRAQLLRGDWTARASGKTLRREWFEIVDAVPAEARRVRAWDLAATEEEPGKDPDYIAGVKLAALDGTYWIEDIRRTRTGPAGVENLLKQTAELDGVSVDIWIEQEPGSSGKIVIANYIRLLGGFTVRGQASTGDKQVRARPFAAQAEAGNVKLLRGTWNEAFLDECDVFGSPACEHDDQIDGCSLAFSKQAGAGNQIYV